MNVSKQSTVSVTLSSEEVEKIIIDHIMQELHSRHMVSVLPDGTFKDYHIDDKGFHIRNSEFLKNLEFSLTLTNEK